MLRMSDMRKSQRPEMEMVSIPAAALMQLCADVQCLAEMHQKLIRMYETESTLKKHHKAYLHVREEADAMCSRDKILMQDILEHYEFPDLCPKQEKDVVVVDVIEFLQELLQYLTEEEPEEMN